MDTNYKGKEHTGSADMEQISLKELAAKFGALISYIKSKSLLICICGLIGAALGVTYSFIKTPVYKATCKFVLDDGNKGGSLSQYAGLASLAGIDLGGSGGSMFQGDNIIELYKSRTMIEKTLLSEVEINHSKQKLIDRYIASNGLLAKWQKKDHINKVSFEGDPQTFTRWQDSVITDITDLFNKKFLNVSKLDKKLSIIQVEFTYKDELFAKTFTNKLVETVNEFYTQTKTKKSYQNVRVLQHQSDSVKAELNSSISGVASAIDAAPNANPALSRLRVSSQKRQIDVQANSAIYGEMVKNLELSKMSLRQETPLIQLIDSPVLPLPVEKFGKIKGIVLGFIVGIIVTIGYLLTRKFLKELSNENH